MHVVNINEFVENINKCFAVPICFEDHFASSAAIHHMIPGIGILYS